MKYIAELFIGLSLQPYYLLLKIEECFTLSTVYIYLAIFLCVTRDIQPTAILVGEVVKAGKYWSI